MTTCRVLAIDAGGVTAWRRRSGALAVEAQFPSAADGITAFNDYLASSSSSEFRVLADLADEEFALEDIPAARGRDRRDLIARKLHQLHPGSSLATALSEGRRKEGRSDERVLFASLSRPQTIAPWLDQLQGAAAAVVGLYSPGQLAANLPSASSPRLPHRLVVTVGHAGLRQTYLENGRLRFSRLTPLGDIDEAAAACATETAKLRQYLSGRQLPAAAGLSVLVVASAAALDRFRAACGESPGLEFEYVALEDEARRVGMAAYPHAEADALYVHLLMRRLPRGQFAPDALRRPRLLRRADRTIRHAAWFALAAGLLAGSAQAVEALRLRQDATAMRARVATEVRQYEAQLGALPPAPAEAARLRAVVAGYEQLRRHSPMPDSAYRVLGAALSAFPKVTLDRLDWRVAGMQVSLDIHASLAPALAGDPRAQLAAADGFARALRATSAMHAEVTAPPVSVDAGKPLKSNTAAGESVPRFSVRLLQPVP